MNWKRIVLGGLAAGLAINIVDIATTFPVLMPRYSDLQEAGVYLKDPRLPIMPIWILLLFAEGIVTAWLYAAARTKLGPGPKTAVLVGLAIGFFAHMRYPIADASWGQAGRFIPLMHLVFGYVEAVVGALVAGLLYKEEEAAKTA